MVIKLSIYCTSPHLVPLLSSVGVVRYVFILIHLPSGGGSIHVFAQMKVEMAVKCKNQ